MKKYILILFLLFSEYSYSNQLTMEFDCPVDTNSFKVSGNFDTRDVKLFITSKLMDFKWKDISDDLLTFKGSNMVVDLSEGGTGYSRVAISFKNICGDKYEEMYWSTSNQCFNTGIFWVGSLEYYNLDSDKRYFHRCPMQMY